MAVTAFITNQRARVDDAGNGKLDFDALYIGSPIAAGDSRMEALTIDLVAGDTQNALAAKVNAVVDARCQVITGSLGQSVAPAATLAPVYTKLK